MVRGDVSEAERGLIARLPSPGRGRWARHCGDHSRLLDGMFLVPRVGCRWPIARSSRPWVQLTPMGMARDAGREPVLDRLGQIQCARSASRPRATPCAAGIGPAATPAASRARCPPFRIEARHGALRVATPSGPPSLNRKTQSRTIRSVTPAIFAASPRLPPSEDQRKSQQAPDLIRITNSSRKPGQIRRCAVRPNPDRRRHRKPLRACNVGSDFQQRGDTQRAPARRGLHRRPRKIRRIIMACAHPELPSTKFNHINPTTSIPFTSVRPRAFFFRSDCIRQTAPLRAVHPPTARWRGIFAIGGLAPESCSGYQVDIRNNRGRRAGGRRSLGGAGLVGAG